MSSLSEKPNEPFTGKVVLGRYHVVLPLGRGGQGTVHLARAEGAAGVMRPVVIKRILDPILGDPAARARFVSEARITARLRHPDIVSIVEFERQKDRSYLMVLEYVHGYDLWRWARFVQLRGGEIPSNLLAYVGTRVLDALHYSHALRDLDGNPTPIIHRDVSGGNVLIDVTGHVKLTDFGIAAMVTPQEESGGPRKHSIQGKLGYIAPELFQGGAPSPASDIYACGVMLHALLLGRNEFHASDALEAEHKALNHVGTRVDRVRRDVSSGAADVVARALAKNPRDRFESAAVFSAELRRAFEVDVAEVREEFALCVESDFEDPQFARTMGVLSLRQIDTAWRKQVTDFTTDSLRMRKSSVPSLFPVAGSTVREDVTRHDSPPSTLPATAPQASTKGSDAPPPNANRGPFEDMGWLLAIVLSVALVVVVGAFAVRSLGSSEVLYVEAQTPDGIPAKDAASAAATSPGQTVSAHAPGESLTARFAQHRADVSGCFRARPKDAEGLAKVSITFEVEPGGKVEHAELSPSHLSSTPLGACLIALARQTDFGKQAGYMRFRIPISTGAGNL